MYSIYRQFGRQTTKIVCYSEFTHLSRRDLSPVEVPCRSPILFALPTTVNRIQPFFRCRIPLSGSEFSGINHLASQPTCLQVVKSRTNRTTPPDSNTWATAIWNHLPPHHLPPHHLPPHHLPARHFNFPKGNWTSKNAPRTQPVDFPSVRFFYRLTNLMNTSRSPLKSP